MAVEDQQQFARPGERATVDTTTASPSVLAVVVTHNPEPQFEATLRSLAAQDYPRLSVVVVDAGSDEDLTDLVTSILPAATVTRTADTGFGAAANVVLDGAMRAALYLFCHDDVALRADAVSRLVEEVLRSNAAVVGPKLVEWDDPSTLKDVGLLVDKFGVSMSAVEPGELDQEQHDALTDVFAVPGGCTMIRADLFRTIGGYDEGISFRGDDVDLCWRAQVAGARVMVVPAAVVRHREQLAERRGIDDVRRLRMRHQLRTVLTCSSAGRLLRVIPQAMILAIAEIAIALFRGRFAHARDVAGAWTWNLRRIGDIRRRRKQLKQYRQVSDSEVHQLQVRGSVRLRAFLRGQIGRHDVGGLAASGRNLASSLRSAPTRNAITALVLLTLIVAIGSRHLITRSIPAVGELGPIDDGTRALLADWWRGWHTRAMGTSAPAPTSFAFLGISGIPLLGNGGALRWLLVLVPLPAAGMGIWRLLRPFGSRNAAVVGTIAYLANPVVYNAYARGSWSALVLFAAAPWIFLQLARSLDARPFRAEGVGGSFAHRAIGLGLLLALIGGFVPFTFALVWIVVAGIVLGSLVAGDGRGLARLLGITAVATVIAAVLNLPWFVTFLRDESTWTSFVGQGASEGNGLGVGDLLRFQTGPMGGKVVGYGLAVSAVFALVLAQGQRFAWAVRCWFVALVTWGVVWAGEQGWYDRPLPYPGVLLTAAALALAVSTALGMAAFENDLRRHRFGWRQAAPFTAVIAFVALVVPLIGAAADGRWHMPARDFTSSFESLAGDPALGASRVLWLGDRSVLPVNGYAFEGSVDLATTDSGGPSFVDRWGGPETTGIPLVRDAMTAAVSGNTSRLGRLLAPFAIRYVVVVEDRAPGATEDVPVPDSLLRALGSQLDLEPVAGFDQSLTVYRNASWAPMRAILPSSVDTDVVGLGGLVNTDLSGAEPTLLDAHDDGIAADGTLDADGDVYLAATADKNWKLEVDGDEVARRDAFGWANAFATDDVDTDGEPSASLRYDTPMKRQAMLVGQVVLWAVAWLALGNLRGRRARSASRHR